MKTVIISGASGGLGKAVCERFLQGEWRVYALTKRAESAKTLSGELARYMRRLNVVVCDLSSAASVQHFLNSSALLQCDAVIHCAGGIQAGKPIEETLPETVHAMLEINFLTAFNLLRSTIPLLKVNGGVVLTIAAKSALSPEKDKSAYAASKAALVALTHATAQENKQFGIRANCIVPSIIDTPANREWGAPEDIVKWTTPQSIAETAWMLCAEGAVGISGAIIPMMGKV